MGQSKGRSGVWVAQQIVTMLKNKLPAIKVLIDADYDDDLSVPEPHTDSYNVGERQTYPEQFPMVFVFTNGSDLFEDQGEARYEIEKWDLTIALMHSGDGLEINVITELDRLVQAIQETILSNTTLLDTSGIVIDSFVFRKAFGTLLTDGTALLQEAQLGVRVGVCNT